MGGVSTNRWLIIRSLDEGSEQVQHCVYEQEYKHVYIESTVDVNGQVMRVKGSEDEPNAVTVDEGKKDFNRVTEIAKLLG